MSADRRLHATVHMNCVPVLDFAATTRQEDGLLWDLDLASELELGLEWAASVGTYLRFSGYDGVRAVFSSIYGTDAWPWTVVQLSTGERVVKVIGTSDECVIELGSAAGFGMFRRDGGDEYHVRLPPACRH